MSYIKILLLLPNYVCAPEGKCVEQNIVKTIYQR